MNATISQARLDKVFSRMEAAAVASERAPQMQPHGPLSPEDNRAVLALARVHGRLRIEIFAFNWRVITICDGAHAGKHTLLSPHKGNKRPYLTIQKGDLPPGQRQQPSSPPLLRYAGQE